MNIYAMGESMLRTFVMIYVIFFFAAIIISIVNYVLMSVGMYQMGKRRGKENPWMAFIPFARKYFQGSLAGSVNIAGKTLEKAAFWMVLLPIIKSGITIVSYFIIWGAAILSTIRYAGGYYSSSNIFGGIPVFFMILVIIVLVIIAIGMNILTVLVNNRVYSYGLPKDTALFHAVAGAFIPLYQAVCYFLFREKGEDHSADARYRQWNEPHREQQGSSAYRYGNTEPVYTAAPAAEPIPQPQEMKTPAEEPEQKPTVIYVEPAQESDESSVQESVRDQSETENEEKLS